MMTDTVTLVKANGTRTEGIRASITSKGITTFDGTLPIEEGDIIERERPGSITERFTVLDAGYHEKFHSIPAHFQMKVRKETAIPHIPPRPSNNYYLTGPNSRVNQNSVDASVNISSAQVAPLFEDLRAALMQIGDKAQRETILVSVKEMEEELGSPGFLQKYQAFMQAAANHVTVAGPYLPTLTQLLGS